MVTQDGFNINIIVTPMHTSFAHWLEEFTKRGFAG